ncbi:hypothetical protein EEJ31_11165 [Cryobacterium tepidiphilum]|uniref:Large extracellular alpha-helical protein n=2 Tax=Cryobacterium tepidiphilum TaxID=2486026 RepID=A0A3M8L0K7_9MICO|nr:hypothetical protein EEJ31_11165 [Cryobacterium tepidiphilum]
MALAGARVGVGVAGIAVAAATVAGAALVDWPSLAAPVPSAVITPEPDQQSRVCPGPLLTLAEDSSQASAATSVGGAQNEYGAIDAQSTPVPVQATPLMAADNADADADGSPVLLQADPAGSTLPQLAGSQSQTASAETIGGLAVAACTEAVGDAWLVGGSTDLGHTSLVLLSNPSTVAATVNLTVYGETGQVDAPGSTGILVQPGSQRIVSLAGLAPNVNSPVVRVQSRGGQVAASLEESVVQGIETAGVELVGATNAPAAEQIIPGIVVPRPGATSGEGDAPPAEVAAPSARVLTLGDEPATVQVGLISEDGASTGTSLQIQLQPGLATKVPLDGLAPGRYTMRLTADQPIVAAARTTTTDDFAWFTASAPQKGDFLVAVADGVDPTLHLFNPGTADAKPVVTQDGAASAPLTVPAGQAAVVPVAPGSLVSVTDGAGLVGSVSYSGDGLLSAFAVTPPGALAAPITVYTH